MESNIKLEIKCKHCRSKDFVKYGTRRNLRGRTQIYKCKSCKRYFTPEDGFRWMRHDHLVIADALDMHEKGMSLKDVVDNLEQFKGVVVSRSTILYWKSRYGKLLEEGTSRIRPTLSSKWCGDETCLYFRKNQNYYWVLLDFKSRFIINHKLTDFRRQWHGDEFFKSTRSMVEKEPESISTDGLLIYRNAIKLGFPNTDHIRYTTNKMKRQSFQVMERFNGTVKQSYKVTRGYHSMKSAMIELRSKRIYYNFIRKHMGLGGKTPAQIACLDLNLGRNRWLDLIRFSVGVLNG